MHPSSFHSVGHSALAPCPALTNAGTKWCRLQAVEGKEALLRGSTCCRRSPGCCEGRWGVLQDCCIHEHAATQACCLRLCRQYRADVLTSHPFNNVTENIFAKIGANLHRRPDHPICIIKEAIYAFFDERCPGVFTKFDDLHPVVSARAVRLLCPSHPLLSTQIVQTFCMVIIIMGLASCADEERVPHAFCVLHPILIILERLVSTACRTLTRCWCRRTTCRAAPTTPTMWTARQVCMLMLPCSHSTVHKVDSAPPSPTDALKQARL